jgi:hypothetical protein
VQAVIIALADRQVVLLHPLIRGGPRVFVRGGGLGPHAKLQKNVRRHVQRMMRFGSDLGVTPCGGQREEGVIRIVKGMD